MEAPLLHYLIEGLLSVGVGMGLFIFKGIQVELSGHRQQIEDNRVQIAVARELVVGQYVTRNEFMQSMATQTTAILDRINRLEASYPHGERRGNG